jgi:hypothetical protein
MSCIYNYFFRHGYTEIPSSKEPSPFEKLSDEVLVKIFKELEHNDLLRAGVVSKKCKAISDDVFLKHAPPIQDKVIISKFHPMQKCFTITKVGCRILMIPMMPVMWGTMITLIVGGVVVIIGIAPLTCICGGTDGCSTATIKLLFVPAKLVGYSSVALTQLIFHGNFEGISINECCDIIEC